MSRRSFQRDKPVADRRGSSAVDPLDFAAPMLRIRAQAPKPMAAWTLWTLAGLAVSAVAWMAAARLDVVAVSEGKLVPASYLKIVQPTEHGVVREILVAEGQPVTAGQVLIRMDPVLTEADLRSTQADRDYRRLALNRIDAELSGRAVTRAPDDPVDVFTRVEAQYRANVSAYENALAQERSLLDKARHDLATAEQIREKLERTLPHYVEQEKAYGELAAEGFVGRIAAAEKARERIEKEQELRAQAHIIRSSEAMIAQQDRKLAQITAEYRRRLQAERVEIAAQLEKTRQDLVKHEQRREWLELRAPVDGVVKDLATHTAGTVASPGTILMTLVPRDEKLLAEVWIANDDVGFVHEGQPAKVKLATYQFQKYGMLEGRVLQVSPDATDGSAGAGRSESSTVRERAGTPLAYKALVELASQELVLDARRYRASAGMQVTAEIHLGTRTVMEYLLSPVRKAFHEAARER